MFGSMKGRIIIIALVLAGSIGFFLPDTGERMDLAPGDRLDLPPRTPHSALVGPHGVRCVEAPRWDST